MTLLLLGLCFMQAKGQSQDCISLHLDKSFYVAGETLWFKAYLTNDSGVNSRVLHVDLVSHENQNIASQKILIENNSSFGNITLPTDAAEGFYSFRAYTEYNLNFSPAFVYQRSIPVYQPNALGIPSSVPDSTATHVPDNQGVLIKVDKSRYQPRDSMSISFQLKQGKGNLSVAVVPLELAEAQTNHHNYSQCASAALNNEQPTPPERSLYLQGRLRDPITNSDAKPKLITVYMDKSTHLIKAYADKGAVKIPVYDYFGTGIFQIMNLDPYDTIKFEFIADTEKKLNAPYYNSVSPKRTPVVLEYMRQLAKRRKMTELFYQQQPPDIKFTELPSMVPDKIYRMEDYRDIFSFEEFINEAIGNVRVRTINGLKTIRLFSKDLGDPFPQHPWYIVDGFLTFNEKEVLDIQYQDIVEIRLYNRSSTLEKYFKHFMWNCGVVEVVTRDVKYVRNLRNHPNVVELEGFTPAKYFSSTLPQSNNWNYPDLRGLVYWAPDVFTDDRGQAQLSIPLSDNTGKFAIVVQGMADNHTSIQGYTTFEITAETHSQTHHNNPLPDE